MLARATARARAPRAREASARVGGRPRETVESACCAPNRSCVKRRRRGEVERRRVAFRRAVSEVMGEADADVDRTPRGEPLRCSCCGLHIVGYVFACGSCATTTEGGFSLCAMCFAAHAQLSANPDFGRAHGIDFVVHDHDPRAFERGGEDDQLMLNEILRDRRELMVNGRGGSVEVAAKTACSNEREPSVGSDDSDALAYCAESA